MSSEPHKKDFWEKLSAVGDSIAGAIRLPKPPNSEHVDASNEDHAAAESCENSTATEPSSKATPKAKPGAVQNAIQTYVVKTGDSITSVAIKFGMTLSSLKALNRSVKNVFAGQKLNVHSPVARKRDGHDSATSGVENNTTVDKTSMSVYSFRYSAKLCVKHGLVSGTLTIARDMVLFDPSLSDPRVKTKGILQFQLFIEMKDIINIGAVRPFSVERPAEPQNTIIQIQLVDRGLFLRVKMPNQELHTFIERVNEWASKSPEEIGKARHLSTPALEFAARSIDMFQDWGNAMGLESRREPQNFTQTDQPMGAQAGNNSSGVRSTTPQHPNRDHDWEVVTSPERLFKKGDPVEVFGLKRNTQHNGKTGTVVGMGKVITEPRNQGGSGAKVQHPPSFAGQTRWDTKATRQH